MGVVSISWSRSDKDPVKCGVFFGTVEVFDLPYVFIIFDFLLTLNVRSNDLSSSNMLPENKRLMSLALHVLRLIKTYLIAPTRPVSVSSLVITLTYT